MTKATLSSWRRSFSRGGGRTGSYCRAFTFTPLSATRPSVREMYICTIPRRRVHSQPNPPQSLPAPTRMHHLALASQLSAVDETPGRDAIASYATALEPPHHLE